MSRVLCCAALVVSLLSASPRTVWAQPQDANYDESKVPPYDLPDALRLANGQQVTAVTWRSQRRPELLELFRSQVYGRCPESGSDLRFEVTSNEPNALGGTASRKQVKVSIAGDDRWQGMEILIYLPRNATGPVPTFLGLNFSGNHAIHSDPGIHLSTSWMRPALGVVDHQATEASRGANASRWDVSAILSRGYGLATIYYGDIDPDFHDKFTNGVHASFPVTGAPSRPGDAWGSIGAWAWGLSRALDYFETDDQIDHQHVAVIGHSRLGKTSLWAGARDDRFALVISNNSGCGGAALSRRRFGETVERINTSFPHWFCDNFKQYNSREDNLPVDQHQLIALIAPRPVYIASATDDQWADPRGEFETAFRASPVYELLGTEGLGAATMPPADTPIMGTIGYHLRTGKHDVTAFDWKCYLDFADKHFLNR